jgi:hypothetical protein
VLKPGGTLLFAEHGRAPEPGVARWQDRVDPLWSRLAGACHLNRKMDDLVAGHGFRIEGLANARLCGTCCATTPIEPGSGPIMNDRSKPLLDHFFPTGVIEASRGVREAGP